MERGYTVCNILELKEKLIVQRIAADKHPSGTL
jgi:hypothetical protein